MDSEELLRSIRRWLVLIALLLTIRLYYLASNGYGDAAGDLDDNIVGLFALGVGTLTLFFLARSFLDESDSSGSRPSEEGTHDSASQSGDD